MAAKVYHVGGLVSSGTQTVVLSVNQQGNSRWVEVYVFHLVVDSLFDLDDPHHMMQKHGVGNSAWDYWGKPDLLALEVILGLLKDQALLISAKRLLVTLDRALTFMQATIAVCLQCGFSTIQQDIIWCPDCGAELTWTRE